MLEPRADGCVDDEEVVRALTVRREGDHGCTSVVPVACGGGRPARRAM
ncbi:hypothetical protein EBESD8_51500 [Rhodococcus aetherivorans]|nr:hypothetical protein EBESD8_51500 [Rhodococcus aetherivorans]